MKTYRIKEVFGPTIMGEGSSSGKVVLFLRFAGCNKWTGLEKDREKSICRFCDTDFRGGKAMSAEEIVIALDKQAPQVKNVVISGGEASLQIDKQLLDILRMQGFKLHLETNGSRPLGELHTYFEHITMSPKQPRAETRLECCDDVKLLYPPIHPEITLENFSDFEGENFYLQPVWDKDYEANVRATVCRLYGNPNWRLSLQTHKIIGVQ